MVTVLEHTACGCDCHIRGEQCTASGQHVFRSARSISVNLSVITLEKHFIEFIRIALIHENIPSGPRCAPASVEMFGPRESVWNR